jgi:hypothetical protein
MVGARRVRNHQLREDAVNNPPLSIRVEPSPGSDLGDCFDHACDIVARTGAIVNFDFNEVHCGVRPCDIRPGAREIFIRNFWHQATKSHGCKICYANP